MANEVWMLVGGLCLIEAWLLHRWVRQRIWRIACVRCGWATDPPARTCVACGAEFSVIGIRAIDDRNLRLPVAISLILVSLGWWCVSAPLARLPVVDDQPERVAKVVRYGLMRADGGLSSLRTLVQLDLWRSERRESSVLTDVEHGGVVDLHLGGRGSGFTRLMESGARLREVASRERPATEVVEVDALSPELIRQEIAGRIDGDLLPEDSEWFEPVLALASDVAVNPRRFTSPVARGLGQGMKVVQGMPLGEERFLLEDESRVALQPWMIASAGGLLWLASCLVTLRPVWATGVPRQRRADPLIETAVEVEE